MENSIKGFIKEIYIYLDKKKEEFGLQKILQFATCNHVYTSFPTGEGKSCIGKVTSDY